MEPAAGPSARHPSPRLRRLRQLFDERFTPLLILLLLALAALAWSRRFVLDDAFISFRYARNLVEGHGLVWNAGERVEGYTNFLWTLIISVPIALKIDPIAFCYAIGPVLSTLTLFFTARAALLLLESRPLALLAVLLLGTNPSFAAFATGGLETMLAACLQTAVVWMALRAWKDRALSPLAAASLSIVAAAAILTRPDGAIVAGLGLLSAALIVLLPRSQDPGGARENAAASERESPRRPLATVAALVLPAAVVLGGWIVWKISYYGALLPNTLAAKTGSIVPWAQGFAYLSMFAGSTWTIPFLFVLTAGFRRLTPPSAGLALAFAATLAYIAAVGGDFMEFRLLVPVLPIMVLLIVWTVFRVVAQKEVRAAFIALVLAGWIHHAVTFESTGAVESIPMLADHLTRPQEDWIGIGRHLESIFRRNPDVRIAASACGAIPYYSALPTVDMLGLTDPWVPRHGVELSGEAGHVWLAPFSYLLEKRVNLVLGHPWIVLSSDPPERQPQQRGLAGFRSVVMIDSQQLWSESALILIPLDADRSLAALYVTPHPAVEAAIRSNHWARFPLLKEVE